MRAILHLAPSILATLSCPLLPAQASRAPHAKPAEYSFKVVDAFPHDRAAFTQGLVYHDGFL